MTIRLILGFFLAYFLALWATPMAREAAIRFGVVDAPDGKLKNHREPVAYLGGLAVFGAFLLSIGMTFEFDQELLALLLASTIVPAMAGLAESSILRLETNEWEPTMPLLAGGFAYLGNYFGSWRPRSDATSRGW